jgi:ATP-dependent Zn protease
MVIYWIVVIALAGMAWAFAHRAQAETNTNYSTFLRQVQSGEVSRATIVASQGGADRVDYQLKNGSAATTVVPSRDHSLLEALQQKMVEIEIRDAATQWQRVLGNSAPFLLLLAVWFIAWTFLRMRPAAR